MWLSVRAVRQEFPSLELLSAPDVERLVGQARRGLPRWQRTEVVTRVLGSDAVLYVGAYLALTLFLTIGPFGERLALVRGPALLLAFAAIPVVLAVSAGRALERRALRDRLNQPRCTACGYSLELLPAPAGRTRCPECGAAQWVGPTDPAGAPVQAEGEIRLCTGCGYSLDGLPALEGMVRCPECGHSGR